MTTPFAVMQRAARLAPELDRIERDAYGELRAPWSTEDVLRALYAAGLTLEADVGGGTQSTVKIAMERLGIDVRR